MSKKKFGRDSEYFAYGFIGGKKSKVWHSVLPKQRQSVEPLERLKKMMVGKGYELIQLYKHPYPAEQPFLEYKKNTGWYEYGSKAEVSYKLWMVATKPNGNETRTLSSSDLINASKEAYDIIAKDFSNYMDWKFGILYENRPNSVSREMMSYSIRMNGIKQKKNRVNWN